MTWEAIPTPARIAGLKMQSDANTEMKSRVSCFSSLLNFNNMSRHTSVNIA